MKIMKQFIRICIILSLMCLLVSCKNNKQELSANYKIEEGVVLESIEDVDDTYSWINYKKLGSPTINEFKNNKNLVVKITGDYMIAIPDNLSGYTDIILPEDLKYPNIDSKYKTDSDGHLYLDPKEFTIIETPSEYNDMKIKMVVANTKDDVQDLEKCDIIYMDLTPTIYSKLRIPELEMTLSKEVDIRYAFFKKSDYNFETEDKAIFQYSMNNSGVLFIFNKETEKFESLRIFSDNNLEGYRYNNLLK